MAKRASRNRQRTREPRGTGSRPLWTGQLRLSLVSVPVQLYPAVKSGARLAFHQVHGPSGKRIRYEKVVPGIGPVDTDEILKGYEISKGHYVLLEQDEIEKAKIEARSTCELVQFVDQCEVDPLYFDKPYYLTPSDEIGEEPYRVIRDALRQSRKMALGQIVLRGREHVVSIKPCGEGLLLETLRYADEIRRAAPFFADIGKQKSAKELLELAEELIKRKTAPFDAEAFHDRYSETLRHLIERKAKTKKPIEVGEDEKPARGAEVIDLVQALKESISRGERAKPKAAKRKRAA